MSNAAEKGKLFTFVKKDNSQGMIIGGSKALSKVKNAVEKLAGINNFVIVFTGESGVGKNLFAEYLYKLKKMKGEFIEVNCGAIPESLFQSTVFGHKKGSFTGANANNPGLVADAQDGMLFLDEVGNLSLDTQNSLLTLIDKGVYTPIGESKAKKSNAFIVLATNRDLKSMIQKGEFLNDLYQRFNRVIHIPSLNERGANDIIDLCHHFFPILEAEHGIQCSDQVKQDFIDLAGAHNWKDINIRALKSYISNTIFDDDVYGFDNIDGKNNDFMQSILHSHNISFDEDDIIFGETSLGNFIKIIRFAYVMSALKSSSGNVRLAAQRLNISEENFKNWVGDSLNDYHEFDILDDSVDLMELLKDIRESSYLYALDLSEGKTKKAILSDVVNWLQVKQNTIENAFSKNTKFREKVLSMLKPDGKIEKKESIKTFSSGFSVDKDRFTELNLEGLFSLFFDKTESLADLISKLEKAFVCAAFKQSNSNVEAARFLKTYPPNMRKKRETLGITESDISSCNLRLHGEISLFQLTVEFRRYVCKTLVQKHKRAGAADMLGISISAVDKNTSKKDPFDQKTVYAFWPQSDDVPVFEKNKETAQKACIADNSFQVSEASVKNRLDDMKEFIAQARENEKSILRLTREVSSLKSEKVELLEKIEHLSDIIKNGDSIDVKRLLELETQNQALMDAIQSLLCAISDPENQNKYLAEIKQILSPK